MRKILQCNRKHLQIDSTSSRQALHTTMIHHLWSKISKVTNQDKAVVKREIFIPWEQPMVLTVYFKKTEMAKKKLERWNATVSDDDIFIHVIKQVYDSNWFTKEHMTELEE